MKTPVFLILFFFSLASLAQLPDGRIVVTAQVRGQDTLPTVNLPPVHVEALGGPVFQAKRISYYKLKRDVRAALPYAKMAAAKLKEVNDASAGFKNERQKKKFIKAEEAKLREQFTEEIKNLTVTQGKVLIKLIDRETSNCTYDLVKDLKGGFNAFIYQNVALLWGSNLKLRYDPQGEDAMMEQIVREIEAEPSKGPTSSTPVK